MGQCSALVVAVVAWPLVRTPLAEAREDGAAESAAALSEDSTQHAARLFEAALAHVRERRYVKAAELFEEAYRLKPHYAVLYNLGQAYTAAGEHQHASETFREYLRLGGGAIPPDRRSQVEESIGALQREQAVAKQTCESRRSATDLAPITFVSNAKNVAVVADTGPLSQPIQLSVGSHELEARAEGYQPHRLVVSIPNACPQTIRLTLQPASADSPQQRRPALAPSPEVDDEPTPTGANSETNTLAWALAGSSVVLLGSGIGVYVWTDGRFSDWETEHDELREADGMGDDSTTIASRKQANNELLDKIETMDVVSLALIGVGVVAGGTATYLFLNDRRTGEQPTQVGISVSKGGSWVRWRTTW